MESFWSHEPVIGYRVWNVFRDRVQGLHSVWREPRFSARCTLPNPETAPPHLSDACECGIYAAKDTQWLESHFGGLSGTRVAMGRVELTGRVIEHTDGYRAQQARVVEIAVRTRDGVIHFEEAAAIAHLFAEPHTAIAGHSGRTMCSHTALAKLVTT